MFRVGDIVTPNPVHGEPPPDLELGKYYKITEVINSKSPSGIDYGGGYGVKFKESHYNYGASWFICSKETNVIKLLNKIDTQG